MQKDSISNFISFSTHLDDGIIMTKDYHLVASFQLYGVEFETASEQDLALSNDIVNGVLKALANKNISVYTHLVRRKTPNDFCGKFENPFLHDVDVKYSESLKSGVYKNTHYITLIYNPLTFATKKTFTANTIEDQIKIIKKWIVEFKDILLLFTSNLKDFGIKQLKLYEYDNGEVYSEMLEFYGYLLSGEFIKTRVLKDEIYNYLTGGLQNVSFAKNMAEVNLANGKRKFARCIELKDYTNTSIAGMFDALMYFECEFTLTQSYVLKPLVEVSSALKNQRARMRSSNDDAVSQIEELDWALDQLISGEITFGDYHFELCVFADSVESCKDKTNALISKLNELGFMAQIADIALPAAYFSALPCTYSLRPRVAMISSLNYGNFIGLHNFNEGKKKNNCWGDAVTALKTNSKSVYYLSFHASGGKNKNDFGDFSLANTLILGQSGGGKTVFMNFTFDQMMKFADPNSFPDETPMEKRKFTGVYLDKDKGALGNILACGGRYITIENGKPTGFNPFCCELTPENQRNVFNVIKILVTRNGEFLTALEESQLNLGIETILKNDSLKAYPISKLMQVLTDDKSEKNSLKARLKMFTQGEQFGWVFDNETDCLDFDNYQVFGIDGTEFLDDKDVNGILSYYILMRVMSLADGRRLVIDVDEAWKWLKNPLVAEEVENKFKTIRKQNGFLRLATQSVADFLKLPISTALIEQSATLILLPNPKASYDDYVKGIGLTEEEYFVLSNFKPANRELMVKRSGETVIAKLDLSSLGKANLAILSTATAYADKVEAIFATNESLEQKISNLKQMYEMEA